MSDRYEKYVAHLQQEDCDSLVPHIYWRVDAWVCLGRKMFATSKIGPDIAYAAWESSLFERAWEASSNERERAHFDWRMRQQEARRLSARSHEQNARNKVLIEDARNRENGVFKGRKKFRNVPGPVVDGIGIDPLPNASCWQILDSIRESGVDMQECEWALLLNESLDLDATLH